MVFHSPITRRRRKGALPAVTSAVVVAASTVVISVGVAAVHGFLGDLGRRPCRHFGIFHHFQRFVRPTKCSMIYPPTYPARLPSLI